MQLTVLSKLHRDEADDDEEHVDTNFHEHNSLIPRGKHKYCGATGGRLSGARALEPKDTT